MGIKGPFNLPRPLANHKLVLDFENEKVFIVNVGPGGLPRPLTRVNPTVKEERVAECTISGAGLAFGSGTIPGMDKIETEEELSDLPPRAQEEVLRRARSWCDGLLDSTSRDDLSREDIRELMGRATSDDVVVDEPSELE